MRPAGGELDAAAGARGQAVPDAGHPSLTIALCEEGAEPSGAVLAEIRYAASGAQDAGASPPSHPVVHLDLPRLSGPPLERWTTDRAVTAIETAGMRLATNGAVLFGYLAGVESPGDSLDALVYRSYRRILRETRELGYPHLLRIWNYFPGINREEGGLERYQQLCVGRYRAFAELAAHSSDFRHHLPAATAIGTRSGPLQVYFLAGRSPGLHVENPRQVSAYKYPPLYGPKSPSFARATLYRSGPERYLFVAGTSSIVGHASRHAGDPHRQAVETLRNIETVIATAHALCEDAGRPAPGGAPIDLDQGALIKVYVRHAEDLPAVQAAFGRHLKPPCRCLYLKGDICRANLLVEAEALVGDRRRIGSDSPQALPGIMPSSAGNCSAGTGGPTI